MGVHKFTHEQLIEAHKKQGRRLMHCRVWLKEWKERAQTAERKFKEYAFVDKKPDYFFSFSGGLIFRRWYRLNGLTPMEAEILVMMSYCDTFFETDYKLFKRNFIAYIYGVFDKLENGGYIIKVKMPGKHKYKKRAGYVLTQRGKDLEADYEKYYDKKMAEFRDRKFTPFAMEDGAYFRKVYVTRHDRRIEQGGGRLPYNGPRAREFREPKIINENEKT